MYVCMYNSFKVGKIYKDSKLYLQDIKSLIKSDDTDVKWINVTVARNKRKMKTSRNTDHTLAINTLPVFDWKSQDFLKI